MGIRSGDVFGKPSKKIEDLAIFQISCVKRDFDLNLTLESGQVFRWQADSSGWWIGMIEPEGIVLRLRQLDDCIEIDSSYPAIRERIRDYFRLNEPLAEFVEEWRRQGGPEIAGAAEKFAGLRLVRQDPWECLVSFLASPACPIFRIRRSLQSLSRRLGASCGGVGEIELFRFPSPDELCKAPRTLFDESGFGFRGKSIAETARTVCNNGGADWVRSLRQEPYSKAKSKLLTLPGVGEKIADCVCLFSLDKDEAVPIDVHMARVARYMFDNIPSSLTPRAYGLIAEEYRKQYGQKAGWAQQYLFYGQIENRGIWDDALGRHRRSTH